MEFALMPMRELTVATDSFDVKERVKQAIDIVDLVGSHIQLRRQGRNYVGLCPWHDDSRPSLQVNPERQSFKCWVCDIGGDVFSFVMKSEGVEFREALEMLAERAGIVLEKPQRRQFAIPRESASGMVEDYGEYADGQPRPPLLLQPAPRPSGPCFRQWPGQSTNTTAACSKRPRPTPHAATFKSAALRPRASSDSALAFRR